MAVLADPADRAGPDVGTGPEDVLVRGVVIEATVRRFLARQRDDSGGS